MRSNKSIAFTPANRTTPGVIFLFTLIVEVAKKNMTLTPRGELIVGFVSALFSPLLEWPQPTGITWVKEISGQELMGK